MVRRPPGCSGFGALETQLEQVQLIDEDVDDSDRVVLCDVVVQTLREQSYLLRSSPSMNRFMSRPALSRCHNLSEQLQAINAISHSLDPDPPVELLQSCLKVKNVS